MQIHLTNRDFIIQDHFTSLVIHSNSYRSYIHNEKNIILYTNTRYIYIYIGIILDGIKIKGFQPEKDKHTYTHMDERSYKKKVMLSLHLFF
jgi:hypothetical protein